MLKNWNFYAGIRKLSLEKFMTNCQSINDIKFKLSALNIDHNSFPWSKANEVLVNKNTAIYVDVVQQDTNEIEQDENNEIIQVTVAMPRQKKKNKKIEVASSKDN